jgi:hypothetical protein
MGAGFDITTREQMPRRFASSAKSVVPSRQKKAKSNESVAQVPNRAQRDAQSPPIAHARGRKVLFPFGSQGGMRGLAASDPGSSTIWPLTAFA